MEKTKGKRKANCTYLGAEIPDELAEQVAETVKKKSEQLGIRFYTSDAVRVALKEWVEREKEKAV